MSDNSTSKQTDKSATSATAVRCARLAQREWAKQLPRDRLSAVGRIAAEIARNQNELLSLNPRINASPAEFISSELIPLADACRFTARVGLRALAPTSYSARYAAWWMGRIGVRVTRQPWGVILVLAPSNYPLFLPGVQIIQALAAGNAVVVKPAVGCEPIIERFSKCVSAAGISTALLQVIDSSISGGQQAIEAGVDKVFLTGSVDTGRAVLEQLSHTLTPATLELSGCDAVFVTERADLLRVVRCLAYALQLNGGATCIAPRRVFVTAAQEEELCRLIVTELRQSSHPHSAGHLIPLAAAEKIVAAAKQALADGAELLLGPLPDIRSVTSNRVYCHPLVLRNVKSDMDVARQDLFGPIVSLLRVANMSEAIELERDCPYRLGVSVFGPKNHAEHWGQQSACGCVVINDIIVPTADPRVSFGGSANSGWGTTRGWEGLLEMTRPQTICTRYGNWLPHLNRANAQDASLMSALLTLLHAPSWRDKYTALRRLVKRR